MERIGVERLTDLERERYRECVEDFGKEGFLYYIVEWSAFGYSIVYSEYEMKECVFDERSMRDITDADEMIENM